MTKDQFRQQGGPLSHAYLPHWDRLSITQVTSKPIVTFDVDRLVAPPLLHQRILCRLHGDNHAGITKMRKLAEQLFFWPGINSDIRDYVLACNTCQALLPSQQPTPLLAEAATSPLEKLGCDLYHWGGHEYLVTVDRYSGYIWTKRLTRTSTDKVTAALKEIFLQFGTPTTIRTDNCPQFRGPFTDLCRALGIHHEPASPYHPESNGLAENAVKTCKKNSVTKLNKQIYRSKTRFLPGAPHHAQTALPLPFFCLASTPADLAFLAYPRGPRWPGTTLPSDAKLKTQRILRRKVEST